MEKISRNNRNYLNNTVTYYGNYPHRKTDNPDYFHSYLHFK